MTVTRSLCSFWVFSSSCLRSPSEAAGSRPAGSASHLLLSSGFKPESILVAHLRLSSPDSETRTHLRNVECNASPRCIVRRQRTHYALNVWFSGRQQVPSQGNAGRFALQKRRKSCVRVSEDCQYWGLPTGLRRWGPTRCRFLGLYPSSALELALWERNPFLDSRGWESAPTPEIPAHKLLSRNLGLTPRPESPIGPCLFEFSARSRYSHVGVQRAPRRVEPRPI